MPRRVETRSDLRSEAQLKKRGPKPTSIQTDPVIEAYKKDVDFTLVERNLRLTIGQRAQQLTKAVEFIRKFRPVVAEASGQLLKR